MNHQQPIKGVFPLIKKGLKVIKTEHNYIIINLKLQQQENGFSQIQ